MSQEPVRLCLWSGPRNISTATMRSFEARGDCAVWDEPFYGYYLKQTGLDHPGRAETLALWPTDADEIARACSGPAPEGQSEFFQKHMCQHMLDGLDLGWTAHCRHIFLIRDPAEVAASYHATLKRASVEDLGAIRQARLYDEISALTGRNWPVIEGADVLDNPAAMLRAVCEAVGIAYTDAMLSWPPGRRSSDGPWAPYWYSRVEASSGFEPRRDSPHDLPESLSDVVAQCAPAYERLRGMKLSAS